tara:strand:+ start:102 stop:2246 length:2145 start_codon:yes stop_codon:yes gene_type:complete
MFAGACFFFLHFSTVLGEIQPSAKLPALLEFIDGRRVGSVSEWPERREEIRALMVKYFVGSYPVITPQILSTEITSKEAYPDNTVRHRVRIVLDTPNRVSFEMALWVPEGKGPFPLLLTAPRFYQRYWGEDALKRGYAVCLFPGVDSHHREEDYSGYDNIWEDVRREYPKATWTEISTKAWLASRCIDYLVSQSSVVNISPGEIAIIGFSRYGKQAMIAAAFDERITCVVARSPGSPASSPYRLTSRNTYAETPVDFPSEWFLPSLRKFVGRENELPIDAHGWYALIAPRACLIHTGHNDGSEPTFAVEKAYIEGRSVYQLLGASQKLRIDYRHGGHSSGPPPEQISILDRQRNLDWIDISFGRRSLETNEFPEDLIHDFDWQAWNAKQKSTDMLLDPAASIRDRIRWSLGEAPKKLIDYNKANFLTEDESKLMTHDRWSPKGIRRVPIRFGNHVRGNLYFKEGHTGQMPVVIWLHPLSYHSGYNEGYGVEGTTVYHRLADNGFAVIAYDQCGFGLRLLEGRDFYRNYPRWSKLGRMVMDARDAVSFVVDGKGKSSTSIPIFDRKRLFLLGYSTGALAAMYAGALDSRVTGVACFSGWTPLRDISKSRATGGNRRLWELHALQPRLGWFDGKESELPFDYHDVISQILPKPCLIVTPSEDRFADHNAIKKVINRLRLSNPNKIDSALTWVSPDSYNRFQADQQNQFIKWAKSIR